MVIGNPPYKEKAKGRGGWIESGDTNPSGRAPARRLDAAARMGRRGAQQAPAQPLCLLLALGHLEGVRPRRRGNKTGIVCFITVAGFLNGPGFQKMRDYLRRTCDDIWVIDCSPEGHQPEVNTRIFQGVQQPVCIVLASRSARRRLGHAGDGAVSALCRGATARRSSRRWARLRLDSKAWVDCPTEWRAPFLPASSGAWATYPALEDLFIYNGSGVMPGRTWIIAPDAESLERRWQKLINAPADEKEELFHPHLVDGKLGDRHSERVVSKGLPGFAPTTRPVADEHGPLCCRRCATGFVRSTGSGSFRTIA